MNSVDPIRYERRDVNARIILYIGLGACGCAVLIHCGLLEMFDIFRAGEDRANSAPQPTMTLDSQQPPQPRLLVDPALTLRLLRSAEQARLTHYEWADRKAEEVRIPIARAIELSLERGLPNWQDAKGAPRQSDPEQNSPLNNSGYCLKTASTARRFSGSRGMNTVFQRADKP